MIPHKGAISLFELNQTIGLEIKNAFNDSYWVIAEINEIKVNYSGHCYLELVEKEQRSSNVIAKARATIWANTWRQLKPYFETTAQHAFTEGIKVMLRITVEFHELYGLSLNVLDIDPVYTLGDLQKQKQETIEKLKQEGVFNMNRELGLAKVPQRVAVISSKTAAGFGDFIDQLENNAFNYKFYIKLFPAVMQGDGAEQSIINALEKIFEKSNAYDVVVIIRGGGSKTDLSCFDRYWLSYHVAQFPLPVLTGIGHEQDDTVIDMVAHTKLKTPTAVAAFLIERVAVFENTLDELYLSFKDMVTGLLDDQRHRLLMFSTGLSAGIKLAMQKSQNTLQKYTTGLKNNVLLTIMNKKLVHRQYIYKLHHSAYTIINIKQNNVALYKKMLATRVKFRLREQNNFITTAHHALQLLDPQNVLNRGYSITIWNGKVVKTNEEVNSGQIIETKLKKGNIKSTVN